VRLLFGLLLLTGCRQLLGFESPTPGALDGPDDGFGAQSACAGSPMGLLGERCLDPTGPVNLEGIFETDSDSRCDPDTKACIVAGTSIKIVGALRVRGTRPLVLWSATTIEVGAAIDAGSHNSLAGEGPGANEPTCPVVDGNTGIFGSGTVGAGGAGGSFATPGGQGGAGFDATSGMQITTGVDVTLAPAAFRGGCPGGDGGGSPASRGSGGGVIYLMAVESIRVSGSINASGAGGRGGGIPSGAGGGGGGGSGGLIGLDAPAIDLADGQLVALGGGGGSGARLTTPGIAGTDPSPDPVGPGLGGPQTTANNSGGSGAGTGAINAGGAGGDAQSDTAGGGGGGGGSGYIVAFGVVATSPTTVIAPPIAP
jgi:hypothetical protein